MDSEDVVFVSLSISRLLFFFSGVVFFITGYLIPVTMETAGLTLRDFVLRDTIQRYVLRSVLIAYLPILCLSTLTYWHTSLSTYTHHYLLRLVRTVASLLEMGSLAVYASVTPTEDSGLHHDAVTALIFFNNVSMVLTVAMVTLCTPRHRFLKISAAVKLGVMGVFLVLRFVYPALCQTEECMLDEVVFLPLFAAFHGSGSLDFADKRVVVRNKHQALFDKNVLNVNNGETDKQRSAVLKTISC